jgi:DNA (cytosine-5)-methyltransferase 1
LDKPVVMDLFAGAGGLGSGLERAGFRIAIANEHNPTFAATYALNHPDTRVIAGDILADDIMAELASWAGRIDLVAGGPPCQGFSTAGKKSEDDPRNRLFLSFIRVVTAVRPKVVLFENVSGFREMYGGRAYYSLLEHLRELGYRVDHAILNAMYHGVPQSRERAFVVGTLGGEPFRFPEPTHLPCPGFTHHRPEPLTIAQALSDLPLVGPGESATRYHCVASNDYQVLMREGSSEITDHDGPTHGEKLAEVIRHVPEGGCVLDVPEGIRPTKCFNNSYARLWWDRPSTTITRNFGTPSSGRCIHPLANRGLTTREGARLQGFPDRYRFTGSRSDRNLQVGNAVPPPLGFAMGKAIMNHLRKGGPNG